MQQPAQTARSRHLAPLAIAVIVVVAFAGAINNQLVNWDDLQNLVLNEAYRGLGADQIAWAFTTTHGGHYQPLSWLSFSLDWAMWNGRPVGFHLTNIVLHAATAILLYFCAVRLIAAARPERSSRNVIWGAAFAAALFAIHPLRVESVAWATERRDVLAGALLALSLLLYLRAAQDHPATGRRCLVGSVCAYACSLLAKASGMTFPLVLLALDIYPLRRIRETDSGGERLLVRGRVFEKLPFAVPAVVIAAVAAAAQRSAGALWGLEDHPVPLRLAQAAYGLVFYLWKSFWPSNLIPLYAQPTDATWHRPEYMLSAALLVLLVAAVVLARRRHPGVFVAGVCYLLLVAPVLGLAQSGPQVVADRYSYFACVPLAVLLGAALSKRLDRLGQLRMDGSRRLLLSGAACIVIALVVMTRAQVEVWSDSRTLWRTTIARAPETGLAYANLAAVEMEDGNLPRAVALAEAAMERLPGNFAAHRIAGSALLELGFAREAEAYFQRWLALMRPDDTRREVALSGIARAQAMRSDLNAAERTFAELAPAASRTETALWLMNEGAWLASHSRFHEAQACIERAEALTPESAWPPFALAMLERDRGEREKSIAMLKALLENEDLEMEPDLERRIEMAISEMSETGKN